LTWNEKAGSKAALASHTLSVSNLRKTSVNKPQRRKDERAAVFNDYVVRVGWEGCANSLKS
jgi:hypothetical protein